MLQWTLLWSFLTQPFNLNLNMSFLFISLLQTDCPNGRLTPAKFVDMYKMFFPSGNAEEFCDHVFRTFDMDKNGYIDFKVSQSSFIFIFIFYFHPTISRSATFTLISFKVIPINFPPLTMLTIATLYGNTLIFVMFARKRTLVDSCRNIFIIKFSNFSLFSYSLRGRGQPYTPDYTRLSMSLVLQPPFFNTFPRNAFEICWGHAKNYIWRPVSRTIKST